MQGIGWRKVFFVLLICKMITNIFFVLLRAT